MLNFVHLTYQYYLKMQKYIQIGPFGLETYKPQHDKTSKMNVRPAKTQIKDASAQSAQESLLCTQWVAKNPSFLHADSEDSDQTGRTAILLVLSCHGSIMVNISWSCLKVTKC